MLTVLLFLATLPHAFLSANENLPPTPPASLKPWVDYARALHADDACPPGAACVQLSRIEFHGRVSAGTMLVKVTGQNLGKRAAQTTLLGPSKTFSITRARFTSGQGTVLLADDAWAVKPQPGAFTLETEVHFSTDESVSLDLASPVAHIVDALEQGSLTFDDTSNQHGGSVFLQQESRTKTAQTVVSTRVARAFTYGGTTTFTYRYVVSGLREQTRMQLALLGGEAVEDITPNLPYTVEKDSVGITLMPGASTVTLTGHFVGAVTTLTKPTGSAFEYWLLTSDARHPVDVASEGVEIDAADVKDLPITAASRAFMLTGNEKLTLTPLQVNVDKGRQGSGNAAVRYRQSNDDTWLGDLTLKLATSPGTDRLVVTTPAPAHFAAVGGRPVRMFKAAGDVADALSLRVSGTEKTFASMRVQWREALSTNAWLALVNLQLPGQAVHLDAVRADVDLRPGFVPLAIFGAEHASGDFFTGLRLYAVLLALLGAVLAREARLPKWAIGALLIMLAGLYSVGAFPEAQVLSLLAGTVVIVRLPNSALQRLAERRIAHRIIVVVWVMLCLGTMGNGLVYIQDRLLSAMHPWAMVSMGDDDSVSSFFGETFESTQAQPAPAQDKEVEEDPDESSVPPPRGGTARSKGDFAKKTLRAVPAAPRMKNVSAEPAPSMSVAAPVAASPMREKTLLPVAFAPPTLPSVALSYGFGSVPAGESAHAALIVVGPFLRGLWMFAECAALAAIIGLLISKSRRLIAPGQREVQP